MLLKNVLDQLIQNELANLSIGKPEWSTGNFNYTRLIQCISLGYIELHKRFTLKKELVVLQPMVGITEYVLDIEHAVSNTASTEDKYIIDTSARPFSNKIAKIDTIYDYTKLPIDFNNTQYNTGISLLDYRTIYIEEPDVNHTFNVMCRAIPEPIVLEDEGDLATYNLDIPYQYLEPLLLYAAGRAHNNRGTENATNNEGAVFMARFEAACVQITHTGLDTHETSYNNRLTQRGFV